MPPRRAGQSVPVFPSVPMTSPSAAKKPDSASSSGTKVSPASENSKASTASTAKPSMQTYVRPSTPEDDALSKGASSLDRATMRSSSAIATGPTGGKRKVTNPTPIKLSTKVTKPKTRSANPTSKGFSLTRLAVQITALYALVAYFFICPNDPSRAPAVCQSYRNIDQYRQKAVSYLEPYTRPHIAQARAVLEPQISPYINAAAPYYASADKAVRPQIRRAQSSYTTQVKPRLLDAVTHSHRFVRPHWSRAESEYNRVVTPHITRYSNLAKELYDLNAKPYVDEVLFSVKTTYRPISARAKKTFQPVLSRAYPAAQHHLKYTVLPLASTSYATTRKVYVDQVFPKIVTSGRTIGRIGGETVLPWLGRFQSKYVYPQLSKIQDRAWAYKAKKVADEKVIQMDKELGKDELVEEIADLRTTLLATLAATTADPLLATPVGTVEPIPDVSGGPDASANLEEKDDPIAQAIRAEAAQVVTNAEARKAVIALHDLYEAQINKLGDTELALLADRLSTLRMAAVRDIPVRFAPSVKSFSAECAKWVGRLDKYWDKAARDERTSVENKLEDGDLIARKAGIKLGDQAEEIEDEVDAYLRVHTAREITSVERAFKTIETLVSEAQEDLGAKYAKLADISPEDWKRYNTLGALQGSIHHRFSALRDGSLEHPGLASTSSVSAPLEAIKQEVASLSQSSESSLQSSRVLGEKLIRGQFLGVQDAVTRGYGAVTSAISSVISGTTVTPTDAAGTASSLYSQASASAISLGTDAYDSAASLADSAASSASSLYASAPPAASILSTASALASDAAMSAAAAAAVASARASSLLSSLSPSVTSVGSEALASASSLASVASASASSAYAEAVPSLSSLSAAAAASASSVASVASASVSSVYASGIPAASSLGVEAIASASSLAAVASSGAEQVISSISAAILPTQVSGALENAQVKLQKVFGDASQDLYRAFGATPSPTDAYQTANNVYAKATDYVALVQHEASELLASYASEASKTAASLAGYKTQPTDLSGSAASAYSVASASAAAYADALASSVSSAADRVSLLVEAAVSQAPTLPPVGDAMKSRLHTATRSAASAIGISVTPEGVSEHAQSAYSQASSVASSLASVAADAIPTPPSLSGVSVSARSLASEISSSVASVAEAASSGIHQATRSVLSAAGATPSPEGVIEHAQSIASSLSSAASSATAALRQRAEL